MGAFFMKFMLLKKLFAICVSIISLEACQGVNPVIDTALSVFSGFDSQGGYKTGYEYLQVKVAGRQAVMALGQRHKDGRNTQEYWYSGQREMLYLQNGRIQQALGMTHEVREQLQQSPDWELLTQARAPYAWQRTLDVQPGYRYGVKEYVVTQKFAPNRAQQELLTQPALWFEDTVTSKAEDGKSWKYKQVFALVSHQVVYSEQCVAQDLCFTLKHLGIVKP
jgi:hypothetical protein